MSKSDTFENDLVALIFNGTAIANIADNAATAPLTNLYLALHTADPGEAGVQNASEASYVNYARVAVPRNSSGFTVSGNQASLTSAVQFGAGSAAENQTLTHFSVGVAASGATKILYRGTLAPNVTVTEGVIPELTTGTNVTEN